MMIEVVSTKTGFLALRDEWNALADAAGYPLLRHEFCAACVEAYGGDTELAIFVAREGGAVRAIAPLHVARYLGVRRLETLSRKVNEPTGFLGAHPDALAALFKAIVERGLPIFLNRLSLGSPEAQSLRAALGARSSGFLPNARAAAHMTDGRDVA
jgi:CelD/BcsL family acetyltransferase involved in cellulose biosynthesis